MDWNSLPETPSPRPLPGRPIRLEPALGFTENHARRLRTTRIQGGTRYTGEVRERSVRIFDYGEFTGFEYSLKDPN